MNTRLPARLGYLALVLAKVVCAWTVFMVWLQDTKEGMAGPEQLIIPA
jgi:hypothetical protein